MKKLGFLCTLLSLCLLAYGHKTPDIPRQKCIDQGWYFLLGDGSAALSNPLVIDDWRVLDLPHDWSVEPEAAQKAGGTVIGPFSSNSVGGYQTGFTVGGEGWYAKRLRMTGEGFDGKVILYFEGAYNETEVYVNGQKLAFNPYGYSSFRVDATDALHSGENVVLVRVRNEGNNSRWYAGSGIYRHVWLIQTPPQHLDKWETAVTMLPGFDETGVASVSVQTRIFNETASVHTVSLSIDLLDDQEHVVASTEQCLKLPADGNRDVQHTLPVKKPRLWSVETPYLYTARLRLRDHSTGRTDELRQRFGLRTLHYSADRGFLLNGNPILLRGGCVHHDHGLLGAASFDRAEERKLQLLKAEGYNAVRTSHGLPSEHFLDACDSLGLLVIDEAFDQWLLKKNREDYHRYFPEWSDHDVQTMVRRDRNHPSIILWSIGNEIPGRIESAGMEVAERLRKDILALDTTRAITAAICSWDDGDAWNSAGRGWEAQDDKAFQSLDVGGYNYLFDKYEHDHATHPDRVMCGTESFPKQMSQNWDLVEKHPYVIGDFIWTAMDYLGEAGIGSAAIRREGEQSMFQPWPWFNGWCGDIDLIGQKKPQSYYHDVVWRRKPVTMAVERPVPEGFHQSISLWGWQLEQLSWTFPDLTEGAPMHVNVYSRAPRVRLYLNSDCIGEHATGDTYWTAFTVPYRPGRLRAVNLDTDGNELPDETQLRSASCQTTQKCELEDRTSPTSPLSSPMLRGKSSPPTAPPSYSCVRKELQPCCQQATPHRPTCKVSEAPGLTYFRDGHLPNYAVIVMWELSSCMSVQSDCPKLASS